MKKKNIILIIIVIICLFLLLLNIVSKKKLQSPSSEKTTNINNEENVTYTSSTPIIYDNEKSKYLSKILKKRPVLTPQDKDIRSELEKGPVPLVKTDEFQIAYIPAADLFMSELHTMNLVKAKENAVAWLKDKGLSNDGICKLPIVFYLDTKTANNLSGLDVKFNPLPNSCDTTEPLASLISR